MDSVTAPVRLYLHVQVLVSSVEVILPDLGVLDTLVVSEAHPFFLT